MTTILRKAERGIDIRGRMIFGSTTAALLLALAVIAPATTLQAPTEVTLFAGQTTSAGRVTVENDAGSLYVTFTTSGDWKLQETHLHVADTLSGVPTTRTGNPKVGNFAYQTTHAPLVTTFTYTIPLSALSLDPNQSVVVAAHAVVVKVDGAGNVVASETGWADGPRFTQKGSWATYLNYVWQECRVNPPVATSTETAFAYDGGYPGACFLDLDLDGDGDGDFNRWGWTIGPLSPGAYRFEIFAGAGRCDTSKGTYVGYLTVDYFNGAATVTYNMEGVNPSTGVAYNLVEAHLYVGNEVLPRDVNGEFTVAPGQYPDIAAELGGVRSKTFVISGLSGNINVVAHAVVAGFPE